jgi:hypothetical protein
MRRTCRTVFTPLSPILPCCCALLTLASGQPLRTRRKRMQSHRMCHRTYVGLLNLTSPTTGEHIPMYFAFIASLTLHPRNMCHFQLRAPVQVGNVVPVYLNLNGRSLWDSKHRHLCPNIMFAGQYLADESRLHFFLFRIFRIFLA